MMRELEQVWDNIEETKVETTSIVQTFTSHGNSHFDVDKSEGARKRKDRYSSLLLAAYAARRVRKGINDPEPEKPKPLIGGWAGRLGI
jgi:hypothetical protein